jgi:uncharacterized OB-fold protein
VTDQAQYPLDIAVPDPDGPQPSRRHWYFLRDHELRLQVCTSCGQGRNPATEVCSNCQSTECDWELLPAEGTIYTWSRVWHPANDTVRGRTPYLLVWVEIDHPDKPHYLGNLLGDAFQEVAIGDKVEGVFQDGPKGTVLNWRAAR